MTMQSIRRDNGPAFVGDFHSIVGRSESDCDPMPQDCNEVHGRWHHILELYAGTLVLGGEPVYVLVIEGCHASGASRRLGFAFRTIEEAITYTERLDPCEDFGFGGLTADQEQQLRDRYERRRIHFWQLAQI